MAAVTSGWLHALWPRQSGTNFVFVTLTMVVLGLEGDAATDCNTPLCMILLGRNSNCPLSVSSTPHPSH